MARLSSEVQAIPGDVVDIRVAGLDVTSAAVVADGGDGGIILRLTGPLADA